MASVASLGSQVASWCTHVVPACGVEVVPCAEVLGMTCIMQLNVPKHSALRVRGPCLALKSFSSSLPRHFCYLSHSFLLLPFSCTHHPQTPAHAYGCWSALTGTSQLQFRTLPPSPAYSPFPRRCSMGCCLPTQTCPSSGWVPHWCSCSRCRMRSTSLAVSCPSCWFTAWNQASCLIVRGYMRC